MDRSLMDLDPAPLDQDLALLDPALLDQALALMDQALPIMDPPPAFMGKVATTAGTGMAGIKGKKVPQNRKICDSYNYLPAGCGKIPVTGLLAKHII